MLLCTRVTSAALLTMRHPRPSDVAQIHGLVRASGLDLNSPYMYAVGAAHFAETSLTAWRGEELAGFVHAYRPPTHADTLFVHQVATDASRRQQGAASSMLLLLLDKLSVAGVRFLEATISDDNAASQRLFSRVSERLGCPLEVSPDHVPACEATSPPMKAEGLYRIGPFSAEAAARARRAHSSGTPSMRDDEERPRTSLLVRDLADVEAAGNYKRGSLGFWESRRYLTRADGLGFSFHHTVMYKGRPSFLWCKNHVEAVYISQGEGTIEVVDEGSPEQLHDLIGTGQTYKLRPGTVYALRGEKHILTATSEGGMHCMCVFNPPVAGVEDHDSRGVYPAIDDDGRELFEYGAAELPSLFKPPSAFREGSEWCT